MYSIQTVNSDKEISNERGYCRNLFIWTVSPDKIYTVHSDNPDIIYSIWTINLDIEFF